MKKILIAKGDALGDLILSTTVLKALKQAYPDAHITYLIRAPYNDLIRAIPEVDDVLIDDLPPDPSFKDIKQIWSLAQKLRKNTYDIFLGMYRLPAYGLLGWLANIPLRAGFSYVPINRIFYNRFSKADPRDFEAHEVEWNLGLLQALNIPIKNSKPTLGEKDIKTISKDVKMILLDLDSKEPSKRLSEKTAEAIIVRLLEKTNHELGLLTAQHSEHVAKRLMKQFNNKRLKHFHFLPLTELADLMRLSELVIAPDTGVAHMASALKRPLIMIFKNAIQNPLHWGPSNDCYRILSHRESDDADMDVSLNAFDSAVQDLLTPNFTPSPIHRKHVGFTIGCLDCSADFVRDLKSKGWRVFILEHGYLQQGIKEHTINLIVSPKSKWYFPFLCMTMSNHTPFYPKVVIANSYDLFATAMGGS